MSMWMLISNKHHMWKNDYVWNPSTSAIEIDQFLKSIISDSIITCNKVIDASENVSINFNEKKSYI